MSEELKEQIRQLLKEELRIEVYGGTTYVAVRLMLNGVPIDEDETQLSIYRSDLQ